MSENLFRPLVTSLMDCGKVLFDCIENALGFKTLDFKKFFVEVALCNKSKEYPELDNIYYEEYFDRYSFKCPVGITCEDF